jgi:predicted nucleic acid-binding protein
LEERGNRIGPLDLLIAAQARSIGATLREIKASKA